MDRLKVSRELASRYLNDGFSGGEKKRVEILQMAILQQKIAVLDVQRYLPSSVYAANYGNFEDPEEIDLYDKMLRETDPAKQRSLIRDLEKYVLDTETHAIFLLWYYRMVPHRSYVKGWKISPSHYLNQDLATIWLDK